MTKRDIRHIVQVSENPALEHDLTKLLRAERRDRAQVKARIARIRRRVGKLASLVERERSR